MTYKAAFAYFASKLKELGVKTVEVFKRIIHAVQSRECEARRKDLESKRDTEAKAQAQEVEPATECAPNAKWMRLKERLGKAFALFGLTLPPIFMRSDSIAECFTCDASAQQAREQRQHKKSPAATNTCANKRGNGIMHTMGKAHKTLTLAMTLAVAGALASPLRSDAASQDLRGGGAVFSAECATEPLRGVQRDSGQRLSRPNAAPFTTRQFDKQKPREAYREGNRLLS